MSVEAGPHVGLYIVVRYPSGPQCRLRPFLPRSSSASAWSSPRVIAPHADPARKRCTFPLKGFSMNRSRSNKWSRRRVARPRSHFGNAISSWIRRYSSTHAFIILSRPNKCASPKTDIGLTPSITINQRQSHTAEDYRHRREWANPPKRTRMRELLNTAANTPLIKVQRPPISENPFMIEFSLLSWVKTRSEESIIANVRRVEISGARRIAISVPGSGPRESMRVTKKMSTD